MMTCHTTPNRKEGRKPPSVLEKVITAVGLHKAIFVSIGCKVNKCRLFLQKDTVNITIAIIREKD